jgi:hypothetical protein
MELILVSTVQFIIFCYCLLSYLAEHVEVQVSYKMYRSRLYLNKNRGDILNFYSSANTQSSRLNLYRL